MIWDLSPDFRCRSEPMNFVLERLHHTRPSEQHPEGRTVWSVRGYYSGLRSAIQAIPDELAHLPEITDFNALLARLDAVAGDIAKRVAR